jgi:hypothetical protein
LSCDIGDLLKYQENYYYQKVKESGSPAIQLDPTGKAIGPEV